MLTKEKLFVSPQTGSEYVKVTLGYEDAFVAVRKVGFDQKLQEEVYRISIRADFDTLHDLESRLSSVWAEIKDNDHISVVTNENNLKSLVSEAINALGDTEVNESWYEDVNSGVYTSQVAHITCPYCDANFQA